MKLTIWIARRNDGAVIIEKTRKEANTRRCYMAGIEEVASTAQAGDWAPVEKLEVEYADGFDLFNKAHAYGEDDAMQSIRLLAAERAADEDEPVDTGEDEVVIPLAAGKLTLSKVPPLPNSPHLAVYIPKVRTGLTWRAVQYDRQQASKRWEHHIWNGEMWVEAVKGARFSSLEEVVQAELQRAAA